MSTAPAPPVLSLILCSRNDRYQGNSLWRLQTTLNYAAKQLFELGRENSAEIIVTDWGSEVPLSSVLDLTSQAQVLTRFLEIPPAVAREKSRDSPFPEVLAHNAAIRRVTGDYVGRLDQDTLVDKRFFKRFFELVEGSQRHPRQPESSFMFISRRCIPYAFSHRCHPFEKVCAFLERFHRILPREGRCRKPWFDAPTGIAVMHRKLWEECRGYDETLIYWGFMEADLAYRVATKYPVVNLERFVGCDFYHLAHSRKRFTITDRKRNPRRKNKTFHPNGEDWGFAGNRLDLRRVKVSQREGKYVGKEPAEENSLAFLSMAVVYGLPILSDWLWEMMLRSMRLAARAVKVHPAQIEKRLLGRK